MEIKIPEVPLVSIESYSTDSEEVVWFTIQIKLKDREWTVNHRFNYGSRSLQLIRLVPTRWHLYSINQSQSKTIQSEFDDLHQKLKKNSNFNVKLPPKKFRPKSDFLEKRREELEQYLIQVLEFCDKKIPLKLSEFLLLYKFQPNALVHQLADFLKKEPIINQPTYL